VSKRSILYSHMIGAIIWGVKQLSPSALTTSVRT
jgi:hypothetical protein